MNLCRYSIFSIECFCCCQISSQNFALGFAAFVCYFVLTLDSFLLNLFLCGLFYNGKIKLDLIGFSALLIFHPSLQYSVYIYFLSSFLFFQFYLNFSCISSYQWFFFFFCLVPFFFFLLVGACTFCSSYLISYKLFYTDYSYLSQNYLLLKRLLKSYLKVELILPLFLFPFYYFNFLSISVPFLPSVSSFTLLLMFPYLYPTPVFCYKLLSFL